MKQRKRRRALADKLRPHVWITHCVRKKEFRQPEASSAGYARWGDRAKGAERGLGLGRRNAPEEAFRTRDRRYLRGLAGLPFMTEPRKIGEIASESGTINVYERPELASLFADGINGAIFSGTSAKVDFYEVTPMIGTGGHALQPGWIPRNPKDAENRLITFRVTMPARQLLEFCVHTLDVLRTSGEALKTASADDAKRVAELVDYFVRRES